MLLIDNFYFFIYSTREIKPGQTDIGRKIVNKRPMQNYRTTQQQSGTPNNPISSLSKSNHHSNIHRGLPSGSNSNNNSNSTSSSSSQQSTSLTSNCNRLATNNSINPPRNHDNSLTSSLLGNDNKSNTSYNSSNINNKNDEDERGSGIGGGGGLSNFLNSSTSASNPYNNTSNHDSHSTNSQFAPTIPAMNHRYGSYHANEDLLHHNNRTGGQVHHRNPDIIKRSIK